MYLVTVKRGFFEQQCLLENENDIKDLQKSLLYCNISAEEVNVGSYPMHKSPYYTVSFDVDNCRIIDITNYGHDSEPFFDGQALYCCFAADDPVMKEAVETRKYGQLLEACKEIYKDWLVNP